MNKPKWQSVWFFDYGRYDIHYYAGFLFNNESNYFISELSSIYNNFRNFIHLSQK